MRKKVKRALCLIPILLIAALAITYAAIRHNARSPQELIKSKWGIELPQSCVQVYSAIGDIGIDGRGPKYRVFECGDSEDMKKLLQWRSISVKHTIMPTFIRFCTALKRMKGKLTANILYPWASTCALGKQKANRA